MAELPPRYPSSRLTYHSWEMDQKRNDKKRKENIYQSTAASPPCVSQPLCPLHTAIHLGGNFPTSVAARKFITPWSHSSMENSSEICTCWHLPACLPLSSLPVFNTRFCWSLHQLQWRKRCSRIWATVLPPLPHHKQLSSSQCPNCFRYAPIAACMLFSLQNLIAENFMLVIGTDLLLPALPFSLYP